MLASVLQLSCSALVELNGCLINVLLYGTLVLRKSLTQFTFQIREEKVAQTFGAQLC